MEYGEYGVRRKARSVHTYLHKLLFIVLSRITPCTFCRFFFRPYATGVRVVCGKEAVLALQLLIHRWPIFHLPQSKVFEGPNLSISHPFWYDVLSEWAIDCYTRL